jgi:hypothetical protein
MESAMNDKLFHLIAGTIFALVALLHVLRIYMGCGWRLERAYVGKLDWPHCCGWLGLLRLNPQESPIIIQALALPRSCKAP